MAEQILLVPFFLKAWGVDIYSDWLLITAGVAFISIFDGGMQPYFSGLLQELFVSGDMIGYRRAARIACFNYLVLILVASLIIGVGSFAFDWSSLLGIRWLSAKQAYWTAALLAANTLISLPLGVASAPYRAHGEYDRSVLINLLILTTEIILLLLLLGLGQSSTVLAQGMIACTFIAWAILLIDQGIRYGALPWGLTAPTTRELHAIGTKCLYFMAQPITSWLIIQGPLLILGHLAFPLVTVTFATARTLVGFSRQLTVQLAYPFGFELSILWTRQELFALRRLLENAVSIIGLIGGALSGMTIAVGASVAALWLRGRVDVQPSLIMALAVPVTMTASAQLYQLILAFGNRPRPVAYGLVIYSIVGLSSAIALAPYLGAAGVAIGLGIGEMIGMTGYLQIRSLRAMGIENSSLPLTGIFRAALAAALSYGIAKSVAMFLPPTDYASLLAFGVIWGVIEASAVFFLLLNAEQRAVLLRQKPWTHP